MMLNGKQTLMLFSVSFQSNLALNTLGVSRGID